MVIEVCTVNVTSTFVVIGSETIGCEVAAVSSCSSRLALECERHRLYWTPHPPHRSELVFFSCEWLTSFSLEFYQVRRVHPLFSIFTLSLAYHPPQELFTSQRLQDKD